MINNKQYERYQRQIILKEFGVRAQEKLLCAKVLIVGAGGLGCPALQYLAGAGIGTLGIVDDDAISLNNLHRQVLYNIDDIGFNKAEVAAQKLRALNNDINLNAYNVRLTNENALSIIEEYDVVIDGTDNFSSRYMINDACVLLNKPLVYGAISKFEGQVAVFNVHHDADDKALNYRDLFPEPPKDDEVLNCVETGVLGVLPGIIGTMQANETIKLITGTGKPLVNVLLTYNAFDNSIYKFHLSLNEEAQKLIPKDRNAFLKMDYDWLCSSQSNKSFEIDVSLFNEFLNDNTATIIDVREKNEQPLIDEFEHFQIPLSDLMNNTSLITKDKVIVFCQSGKRSLQAAQLLKDLFDEKEIYNLKGGIVEWKK